MRDTELFKQLQEESVVVKDQKLHREFHGFRLDGGYGSLNVVLRYDDECGNGHNTFSITGTIFRDHREWGGGCIHKDIEEFADKETSDLTKWHLCSSDMPMHYLSNALYLAGDRDYRGLQRGDPVRTDYYVRPPGGGLLVWWPDKGLTYSHGLSYTSPPTIQTFKTYEEAEAVAEVIQGKVQEWVVLRSEGKERELDAARRAAIWPEATDEELCLPRSELKEKLLDRLPGLMQEFRRAMENLGFTW